MRRRREGLTLLAAILVVALVGLGAGGYWGGGSRTTESVTAPSEAGFDWIHKYTREVARYDTTHSRYLFDPVEWSIDRNDAAYTTGFLRCGGNGVPMDTSGAGTLLTYSIGIPVRYDSRVMGILGTVGGVGGAASCTLRAFRTEVSDDPALKLFEHVFSGGGIYDWPESSFAVTGEGILSWSLECSASVKHPHFRFRLCRADTLP